jgi:hypothetical protein
MGLASHKSPSPLDVNAPVSVGVIDTIQMKESLGIAHAPGIVAILDTFRPADPQTFVGRRVRLRTLAGRELPAQVDAVRDHGTTISFFFRGLTTADLPIGSRIEFEV